MKDLTQNQLADLIRKIISEELDKRKRVLHQSDIVPRTVKQRHLEDNALKYDGNGEVKDGIVGYTVGSRKKNTAGTILSDGT